MKYGAMGVWKGVSSSVELEGWTQGEEETHF